jgi:hypothetical protein
MKKKSLRSGMTVITRNGNIYLVIGNFISRKNGFELLSSYTEDLLHVESKSYDIMQVFHFKNRNYQNHSSNLETLLNTTLISMKLKWERQNEK